MNTKLLEDLSTIMLFFWKPEESLFKRWNSLQGYSGTLSHIVERGAVLSEPLARSFAAKFIRNILRFIPTDSKRSLILCEDAVLLVRRSFLAKLLALLGIVTGWIDVVTQEPSIGFGSQGCQ